jgi:hypothetical protein
MPERMKRPPDPGRKDILDRQIRHPRHPEAAHGFTRSIVGCRSPSLISLMTIISS